MTRLARNVLYNLAGQLTLLVLGVVSAKFIFRELGHDVLGIIYFALMVNTFAVAILQLGVTATTIKEIAANERDPVHVERIIRSGACFYWLAYGGMAIAIVALTPWFVDRWITLEVLPPETAIHMLRILGISALLAVPQTFYVSVFRGAQRMGIPNLIDVTTSALQQIGIIAIIKLTGDSGWVVWWIAGTYAIKLGLSMGITAVLYGARSLLPRLDRELMRRTRGFTLHVMAISILATVHTQADKFLLTSFLPVGAIGVYSLLYGTIARGGVLTQAIAQSGFPAMSELAVTGDREQLVATYRRLQDLLCFGLVPLYAALAFAAYPLFSVVLGSAIATSLVVPAALLAIANYLNGTLSMPYYAALATNRPDLPARLNVFALVTTLPVTIVLTWQLGFVGAAASWVWYQLFAILYFVPRACRDCLHIAPASWYRHLGRVVALATATYGTAALAIAWLGMSITALAIGYALATATFALASWSLIGADSKAALLALLRKLRRR